VVSLYLSCCALQAQLKPGAVELLQKAVPALTDVQLAAMQRCPMRSYDPSIVQEPHVYRTQEARRLLHAKSAVCTQSAL
jgi:hypothetical protein